MSPRDLSSASISARLQLMHELLEDLDALGDVTEHSLSAERLGRRALERILTQLVDLAADINQHVVSSQTDRAPADYRSSFEAAADLGMFPHDLADALKPSVGLRNVLVHQYVNTDLAIVAGSVPVARDCYSAYVRAVAMWLSRLPDER